MLSPPWGLAGRTQSLLDGLLYLPMDGSYCKNQLVLGVGLGHRNWAKRRCSDGLQSLPGFWMTPASRKFLGEHAGSYLPSKENLLPP
ncbi:hypothetical protein F4809DRAFT_636620 [Biscogniauxia mediterranea]|nr:hypothetical protein F4809DRAFT_636620 [Biscogniauxia mediterranea]